MSCPRGHGPGRGLGQRGRARLLRRLIDRLRRHAISQGHRGQSIEEIREYMKYSSLLFTVPMILSVVAGSLIFMLVPYLVIRRQRLTPARKIVIGFALIGLLIPLAFEAKYEMTHTEILSQSVWLWPASLGLMALDPYATTSEIVMGFGITGAFQRRAICPYRMDSESDQEWFGDATSIGARRT